LFCPLARHLTGCECLARVWLEGLKNCFAVSSFG